jgi:hypothetical protein
MGLIGTATSRSPTLFNLVSLMYLMAQAAATPERDEVAISLV